MGHTVEHYMRMGMDRPMAEYFAAGRRRIIGVSPQPDFTLSIRFDNGELRRLDMTPLLKKGTVFELFMDYAHFSRVYVDTSHRIAWDIDPTVDSERVWSNKVDLCPDTCYVDSTPIGGGANVN